jgi:hypothetical protein
MAPRSTSLLHPLATSPKFTIINTQTTQGRWLIKNIHQPPHPIISPSAVKVAALLYSHNTSYCLPGPPPLPSINQPLLFESRHINQLPTDPTELLQFKFYLNAIDQWQATTTTTLFNSQTSLQLNLNQIFKPHTADNNLHLPEPYAGANVLPH